MFRTSDTIAAIASAPGGALRGIVRISGPAAGDCWRSLVREPNAATRDAEAEHPRPVPHVVVAELRLPAPWPFVPCSVFWWPGGRSYTRQPTAELHIPGAPPLLDAVLDQVCRTGARLAAPGEFTLRAFLAGRLDLTQAEAVLGVIDARGRHELDVALTQLAGGLAAPLRAVRSQLLETLAHVEAGLDFVEEDIEFVSAESLERQLAELLGQLAELNARLGTREAATGLPRVALVGSPNAGKSSLFNALVGESAALVADVPGTTRDYVERELAVAGRSFYLVDTAGLESAAGSDVVADAAQRMAATQHERSRLQVLCLDASRPLEPSERIRGEASAPGSRLVVLTKSDLPPGLREADRLRAEGAIPVSSRTRDGVEDLLRAIGRRLASSEDAESSVVSGTAARCRDSMARAMESLARAGRLVRAHGGEELVAIELRLALEELGRVAGAVYTDDILDVIFSRFCIGK